MVPSAGRTGGKSSNCKPGCAERDGWPFRNKILDMHRTGMTGWPQILKVQVEMLLNCKNTKISRDFCDIQNFNWMED